MIWVLKALRLIVFLMYTGGVIVGGTIGIFMLCKGAWGEDAMGLVVTATLAFLVGTVAAGDWFSHKVNQVYGAWLARIS